MANVRKIQALSEEDLDDLEEDELAIVREKLIAQVEQIQAESAGYLQRIKELNQARNELQRELAESARSLRIVKHTISQRARKLAR